MEDYSLKACLRCVVFEATELRKNPFEGLGRSIIRAEQDMHFNKTMIDAWKQYIENNNIWWDDK